LQHELETRIGRALIAGNVLDGATIRIDVDDNNLAVTIDNPQYAEVGV
jgi:ATP-dependent Clp protease ATP-binding subunit ClpB